MLGWVSFVLTFLKFPLINASDHRTVSILCWPPLTGIMMKETCVSTMSPTRNTCGLHHLYLWIVYQCRGFLFHCSRYLHDVACTVPARYVVVDLIVLGVDVHAVVIFLCHTA